MLVDPETFHITAVLDFEFTNVMPAPLSARMRESWISGRFWFDLAASKSFELDAIYWAALHDGGTGIDELLNDGSRAELEPFIEKKMKQLRAYKDECNARFSKKVDE
ncbi:hypothetical protein NQ176_g2993 [Zarea fungicola]|uniref:Uncharacterized protein n=1 Tax=Zarea fungicola TaxID=93591 RepID=A0ACC1NND2_9HYPO|nr:hypothetical protein NQ176_g2993 [Lecanicillium fungicola]